MGFIALMNQGNFIRANRYLLDGKGAVIVRVADIAASFYNNEGSGMVLRFVLEQAKTGQGSGGSESQIDHCGLPGRNGRAGLGLEISFRSFNKIGPFFQSGEHVESFYVGNSGKVIVCLCPDSFGGGLEVFCTIMPASQHIGLFTGYLTVYQGGPYQDIGR